MNPTQDFAAVANLDLEPIKFKLMHPESGEGWSQERADAIEREYRRFLYLAQQFPNEQASPLADVDTFWHNHILDTMKYAADCEQAFGYFLHHFPYGRPHGDSDVQAHRQSAQRMKQLYEMTFGEDYACTEPEADCGTAAPKAAHRGASPHTGANDTAYCGFRPPTVSNTGARETAYCGFRPPTVSNTGTNNTAYCGFRPPTVRRAPGLAAAARA